MITEAGLGSLTAIDNGCQEWMKSVKSLTEPEISELNRILDKLRDEPANQLAESHN
jgi:hypothetical protein